MYEKLVLGTIKTKGTDRNQTWIVLNSQYGNNPLSEGLYCYLSDCPSPGKILNKTANKPDPGHFARQGKYLADRE